MVQHDRRQIRLKLSNSSLVLRLSGRSEDFWVLLDITVAINPGLCYDTWPPAS